MRSAGPLLSLLLQRGALFLDDGHLVPARPLERGGEFAHPRRRALVGQDDEFGRKDRSLRAHQAAPKMHAAANFAHALMASSRCQFLSAAGSNVLLPNRRKPMLPRCRMPVWYWRNSPFLLLGLPSHLNTRCSAWHLDSRVTASEISEILRTTPFRPSPRPCRSMSADCPTRARCEPATKTTSS